MRRRPVVVRQAVVREKCSVLLTEIEGFNQGAVSIEVGALEVVKQLAAAGDHTEKAATGVVILGVNLEVEPALRESRCRLQRAGTWQRSQTCSFQRTFVFLNKEKGMETCGHER